MLASNFHLDWTIDKGRCVGVKELLESTGWSQIHGIYNDGDLLEVASSLGTPIQLSGGSYIKCIRPTSKAHAKPATLSATYGTGSFPLHTDTAFWPLPCRYIVMRVVGDFRRSTTVLRFAELFLNLDRTQIYDADHSVWRVDIPGRQFYCSMRFQSGNASGWRYDTQCMRPANLAARKMCELTPRMIKGTRQHIIEWSDDTAVVITNWHVLHGRGPDPHQEGIRELHRIYVR